MDRKSILATARQILSWHQREAEHHSRASSRYGSPGGSRDPAMVKYRSDMRGYHSRGKLVHGNAAKRVEFALSKIKSLKEDARFMEKLRGLLTEAKRAFEGGVPAKSITKKHVPLIWENMLGTVYSRDSRTGAIKYHDYDYEAAHAHARTDQHSDLRIARAPQNWSYIDTKRGDRFEQGGPRKGRMALWGVPSEEDQKHVHMKGRDSEGKPLKEGVLTEISRETLGSYVRKSARDVKQLYHSARGIDSLRKLENRERGLDKATLRLQGEKPHEGSSRNPEHGYYGTKKPNRNKFVVSKSGVSGGRAAEFEAMQGRVMDHTGLSKKDARDFLDSRHGRHLADAQDDGAAGQALKRKIIDGVQRWKKEQGVT